jgi:hypothetical protein
MEGFGEEEEGTATAGVGHVRDDYGFGVARGTRLVPALTESGRWWGQLW